MKKLFSVCIVLGLFLILLAGCNQAPNSSSAAPGGSSLPEAVSSSSQVNSTPVSSSSLPAESVSIPNSNTAATISILNGSLDDVVMGQLYIQLDNGDILAFPYEDADTTGWSDTRPSTSNKITLLYSGSINGTDTANATLLQVKDYGSQEIIGTVDDMTMGQVYIQLDNGDVLAFPYEEADTSGWTNTKPATDNKVMLLYAGTVNGADTSAATLLLIKNI